MSVAPQDAVAEAESVAPPPGAAPEAGSPADAAPVPPPAPAPPTVEIWGKQVLVSEVVRHFDAACPKSCNEGVLIVGRPMPKPFKGTMPTRELCDCAVLGYAAEHPSEAPPTVLSAAARVAAKAPRPPSPQVLEHARAKLTRLRTGLGRETTRLLAARGRITDATAEMVAEVARLEEAEAASRSAASERACRLEAATTRKNEIVLSLHAIEAQLVGLETEAGDAAAEDIRRRRRRQTLDAEIAAAEARAAPDSPTLLKSIEKLERRISTVIGYHPELADG